MPITTMGTTAMIGLRNTRPRVSTMTMTVAIVITFSASS